MTSLELNSWVIHMELYNILKKVMKKKIFIDFIFMSRIYLFISNISKVLFQ